MSIFARIAWFPRPVIAAGAVVLAQSIVDEVRVWAIGQVKIIEVMREVKKT